MKLKKKIIVGVLCLSLLLGVGSVFASRNAGEQLWSWYKSRFEAAKISIERTLESYVIGILPGINKEIEARKDLSVETIAGETNNRVGEGKENIIGVAEGYIKEIEDAQAEITKEMPEHFNEYVSNLDEKMKSRVDTKADNALGEITKVIMGEGEKGREQITKDLTDVKEGAVKELEEAIKKAKEELQRLINEETIESNKVAKENLNKQIDAKRTEINKLARQQEVFQMKSIAVKGFELQAEAIAELDAIIDGFVNN